MKKENNGISPFVWLYFGLTLKPILLAIQKSKTLPPLDPELQKQLLVDKLNNVRNNIVNMSILPITMMCIIVAILIILHIIKKIKN